jgi:hypothetical protein
VLGTEGDNQNTHNVRTFENDSLGQARYRTNTPCTGAVKIRARNERLNHRFEDVSSLLQVPCPLNQRKIRQNMVPFEL